MAPRFDIFICGGSQHVAMLRRLLARFMEVAHELLWCFKDGERVRPSPYPQHWPARLGTAAVQVGGDAESFRTIGNEDTLRNLLVHAVGAGDRAHVFDSRGKVQIYRAKPVTP